MGRTLALTVGLAIVFFLVERYGPTPWLHPSWRVMLIFFGSVSVLTHRLAAAGLQGDRERFVPLYVAATVARLVLGLTFVGVFLYGHVADRRAFVLDFLLLYLSYTGFEIWGVLRTLRQNS